MAAILVQFLTAADIPRGMASAELQHLDTQVVSYAMQGRWDRRVQTLVISSIVANELLLVQSDDPSQAAWYMPLLSKRHSIGSPAIDIRRRCHPFGKGLSDSIVMDFGNKFPSVVEYNSLSIANAINERQIDLFVAATNHFNKTKRKLLVNRFRFLIDNEIRCSPVKQQDVEHAFELFYSSDVNTTSNRSSATTSFRFDTRLATNKQDCHRGNQKDT